MRSVGLEVHRPALALARSEVALRQGRLTEAQAFAEIAAEKASDVHSVPCQWRDELHTSPPAKVRHLISIGGPKRRLRLVARRDALWGQLICATDLESPEATALHSALTSSVIRSNAREILQSSAYGVVYRNRFGRSLDLTDVDAAYALVPTIHDPLVVSSFQSVYSFALVLSARYSDALKVSQELLCTLGIIAWTLQFHTL